MTNEELQIIITEQEDEIRALRRYICRVDERLEISDNYLEEVVNALTDNLDKVLELIRYYHGRDAFNVLKENEEDEE